MLVWKYEKKITNDKVKNIQYYFRYFLPHLKHFPTNLVTV